MQHVHLPVAFALDLPADGAAAAQRKELLLLLLLLWEEKRLGGVSRGLHTPQDQALTLLFALMLKKMLGRSVSGPMEQ